jgi:hypothetical protein
MKTFDYTVDLKNLSTEELIEYKNSLLEYGKELTSHVRDAQREYRVVMYYLRFHQDQINEELAALKEEENIDYTELLGVLDGINNGHSSANIGKRETDDKTKINQHDLDGTTQIH